EVVKRSIATLTPRFSMHRQVKDYTNMLYHPAQVGSARMFTGGLTPARDLAAWKRRVRSHWDDVAVDAETISVEQTHVGDSTRVVAHVRLTTLNPDEVRVQFVTGEEEQGALRNPRSYEMTQAG